MIPNCNHIIVIITEDAGALAMTMTLFRLVAVLLARLMDQSIAALACLHRNVGSAAPFGEAACTSYAPPALASWHFLPWLLLRLACVLGAVFVTAALSPAARGSGIPEMRCIISGVGGLEAS